MKNNEHGSNKSKTLTIKSIHINVRTKICVYFNIITYHFYFTHSLFKTPHVRLFILHHISLKYQFFLIFFNCFSFFTYNNHPFSFFILDIHKKEEKTKCKMNSINVNFHNYCSNYIFLHNFI